MPELRKVLGAAVLLVWAVFMFRTGRISFSGMGVVLPESRSWVPMWSNALDWLVSIPLVIICLLMVFAPSGQFNLRGLAILLASPVVLLAVLLPIRTYFNVNAFRVIAANERLADRHGGTFRESVSLQQDGWWDGGFRGYVAFSDGAWMALTLLPRPFNNGATQIAACAVPLEPTDPTAKHVYSRIKEGAFAERVGALVGAAPTVESRLALATIHEGELLVLTRPYDTVEEADALLKFARHLADDLEENGIAYRTRKKAFR